MKTITKKLIPLMLASLACAFDSHAQTITLLHDFACDPREGAGPFSAVVSLGDKLYGTTETGGTYVGLYNEGTVYSINPDGTDFTTLYTFTGPSGANVPMSELLPSRGVLYGTTFAGGDNYVGSIFSITTNGAVTTLHSFTGYPSDGAWLIGGLVIDKSNVLYGTTSQGGAYNYGTVFRMNTNGNGFKTLYSFSGAADGQAPQATLLLSGDTLYGTTGGGTGTNGTTFGGTVFKINTDGNGFSTLHYTESPSAGQLVLSGGTLYGTTAAGGQYGQGTIFAVDTNGSGYTELYQFVGSYNDESPSSKLLLLGSTYVWRHLLWWRL